MLRQISSSWTPIAKFVFPTLWLGTWGYVTIALLVAPESVNWEGGGTPPPWAPFLFAGIWIGVAAVMALFALPLQRVRVNSRGLLISNYFEERRIPWASLDAVELAPLIRFGEVPIARLRISGKGAGTRVLFLPADRDVMKTILSVAPPDVRARLSGVRDSSPAA